MTAAVDTHAHGKTILVPYYHSSFAFIIFALQTNENLALPPRNVPSFDKALVVTALHSAGPVEQCYWHYSMALHSLVLF